mgnify:CR=1 FL=1
MLLCTIYYKRHKWYELIERWWYVSIYLRFIFLCEKSRNLTDKNLKKSLTESFQYSSDCVIVTNIESFIAHCVNDTDIEQNHRTCTFAKERSRNTNSVKSIATLDVNTAMWCWIETNEHTQFEWLKIIESKSRNIWNSTNQHIRFTHTNSKKWLNTILNVSKNLQKKNIRQKTCQNISRNIWVCSLSWFSNESKQAWRKKTRETFDVLECITHFESMVVIGPYWLRPFYFIIKR